MRGGSDGPWITPPLEGIQFDNLGPSRDYLIDTSRLYDQAVYTNIHAKTTEWELVDEKDAEAYLPTRKEPLKVTLGVKEQQTTTVPTFGSIKLDDYLEYKKGHVINTGGSIWGLDFVPKLNDTDPTTQYIAVAGYRGSIDEHYYMNEVQETGSYKNYIQIWKCKLSTKEEPEDPELVMCLFHSFGVIHDMKWCPYGAYQQKLENASKDQLPKLGILSFVSGDNTVRTIVVPHPDAVKSQMVGNQNDSSTIYMSIKSSRCTFKGLSSKMISLNWGGHKKIAVGYSYGRVTVWNMEAALEGDDQKDENQCRRYLTHSVNVLDAAARVVQWNGHDDPNILLLGGYDGRILLVDLKDPHLPYVMTRIRGIAHSGAMPGHGTCVIHTDNDNISRVMVPAMNSLPLSTKFALTPGVCWDIGASEHHVHFAYGTATGWVRGNNTYHERVKSVLSVQHVVYKLHYSHTHDTYRYVDGVPPQSLEQSRKTPTQRNQDANHMGIQKVVWNNNKETCAFLATGGAAGLCRIEFAGAGKHWI